MRWPRRRPHPDEIELLKSKQRLESVRRRWPEVRKAAETMDTYREINGFAQLIRQAMGVER